MEWILQPAAAATRGTVLAAALAALAGCQGKVTDADIRFAELTEVRALTLQQEREPGKRIVAMIDARS